MAEDSGGQAFLIGLLVTTLVLGALVLAAKTDYRIEPISISNEDYYPNVPLNPLEEDEDAGEDGPDSEKPAPMKSEPGKAP